MRSQGSKPSGFRRVVATCASIALAASLPLLGSAGAHANDDTENLRESLLSSYDPGLYIVELTDQPIATYEGGVENFNGTADQDGLVDFESPEALAYGGHLEEVQEEVADEADVQINTQLTGTLNGFVADLSSEQAVELALDPRVARITPNEIVQPQAVPATEYLELEEAFANEQVGGWDNAGEGVVVGVLDTGIAPENPFFDGEELGTTPGDGAYLDGDTIVFPKGNGDTFTGFCQTGEQFTAADCNDKLIGARYYLEGFGEDRLYGNEDYKLDVVSPRDMNGHGSHTASTSAGNSDVEITTVGGAELGTMSGVAPEARISAYKVCWDGPYPETTEDDGCATSDLVQAIEQATLDGVDVINFSIGGGAATTVWAPVDQAFFGASAAGVFVSASAGNAGPGSSTADHASPWYATVAAATVPNFEGRVTLENGEAFNGASATLIGVDDVVGELVYAGDIGLEGADNPELCLPGTLDPELAEGKIVLCDRGENPRVEKSEVASEAGAIGMVMVNPTTDSLDLDDHSIPSVHVQDTYRDALLAAASNGEEVTLSEVAIGDSEAVAPQVAGFSSRGPMEASGADVLKPDFAAPGVGIIAAGGNYDHEDPTFVFMSGTSMAAPHAAGLGAAYLGAYPDASPAETQSVLTTTATDTYNDDASANTDVFAQGAGMVQPTDMFSPGFFFDATSDDYIDYLIGTGEVSVEGREGIDPSDLNLATIGIGSLVQEQTITRTATAVNPGTYTVDVTAPAGVDVVVEPSTLSFGAAGEEQTFTVTFTVQDGAEIDEWLQGRLVWSDGEHDVRQPIAVRALTVESAERIESDRTWDVVPMEVQAGASGDLELSEFGLHEMRTGWDGVPDEPGSEGETEDGDYWTWLTEDDVNGPGLWYEALMFEEDPQVFIAQTSSSDANSDYDLLVAQFDILGQLTGVWQSGNEGSDEYIEILDPEPGYYVMLVTDYLGEYEADLTAQMVMVGAGGEGDLNVTVADNGSSAGNASTDDWTGPVDPGTLEAQVSWQGLEPDTRYYGAVVADLGGGSATTIVYVDTAQQTPEAVLNPISDQTIETGDGIEDVTPSMTDETGSAEITVEGLPDGVVFEDGVISGTPAEAGTYTVTVSALHELGFESTETFTITVSDDPVPTEDPDPTEDPTGDPDPTAPEPTDSGDGGDGDLPQTGVDVALWLLLLAAGLALVGSGTLVARKRRS
ncbi:MAG TPA: S8 family serine peptidase [Candidatus Agrococcus pullicola]|uniref:S8 family serine peptidase n=1 Tax=Candidatus Agrococcus pullicola TaxID=2838429 RepID=A0A9D1YSI2_9MICO|nr:S8 family serine peptidase [Candidatus Agrococcus pullicola]